MFDGGVPIPLEWPRGSLKRWLAALGTLAVVMLVLYLLFSLLGWSAES